jgi:hypothetical protein
LDQLQLQETQALNQPGVSGSSAGSWVNTSGVPESVLNQLYLQDMYNRGALTPPRSELEDKIAYYDYQRNNPMPTGGFK